LSEFFFGHVVLGKMEIKKEFVQVYVYCVEDGVTGVFETFGPTTHIRLSDVRRVTIYKSFQKLCTDGARTIFHTHRVNKKFEDFWNEFCYKLRANSGFSCTCHMIQHGVNQCTCDFSMVLPLVEVWTKTGKYFVFGDDRFRFAEKINKV